MWRKFLLGLCAYACLIAISNSELCKNIGFNNNWQCENITNVFPSLKPYIGTISCLNCDIALLDENTIKNFRGTIFNLTNSRIKIIKENAFRTFTNKTRKFLFNNNEIESIGSKVFSNFSASDEINLSKNKIYKLGDKVFEGTNVTLLDLSFNSLTEVGLSFNGLRVKALNLSSNYIQELQESAFKNVIFWTGGRSKYGLQELDLSRNWLKRISPNTFYFPSVDNTIRQLFLQNNELTVIENDTFSGLTHLMKLCLESNSISQLYKDSFAGLDHLTLLNVSKNMVSDLPNGLFKHLRSLSSLDLSQNRLTTLSITSFNGLSSLTSLKLADNNLKVIEDTHLVPLGKLATLDISNTRIQDLNLITILDHHYRLRTLVLNDNFWTCSKLVQMYKIMHKRSWGFSNPSRHFDVPNFHGIACSRHPLESYDNLSFDDFLGLISKDRVFEDIFDDRLQGDGSGSDLDSAIISDVRNIRAMMIVISFVSVLLLTHCFIKYLVVHLFRRKIIKSDKISLMTEVQQE